MTSFSAVGGTTFYIRESAGQKQYSTNQTSWTNIVFPVTVENTTASNPNPTVLKVEFTTDITLTNNNDYFTCASSYIQFGSSSLKNDGSRPIINIQVDNYDGLIANGDVGADGNSNIYVYNLSLVGTGSLQIGAGWLGKKAFSKNRSNNYIINCDSSGNISDNGGGILGNYAENVTLIGCSSSGNINANAGGIVGSIVSSVTLQYCWSTGAISGNGAGGIVGSNSISATITNCYSKGVISGNNSGGIIGSNAGSSAVQINSCYSTGNITGSNAGGICGSFGVSTYSVTITNCYTTGNISNGNFEINGGISGPIIGSTISLAITNCYVVGTVVVSSGYIIGNVSTINGNNPAPSQYILSQNYSEAGSSGGIAGVWSDSRANSTLQGTPSTSNVGTTWIKTGVNQLYQLNNMGYTPYNLTNINTIGTPSLIRTNNQSVFSGSSSSTAIISGKSYTILGISQGGTFGSYPTITINSTTGVISTSTSTVAGSYTVYIYNILNSSDYSVTQINLNVQTDLNAFYLLLLLLLRKRRYQTHLAFY